MQDAVLVRGTLRTWDLVLVVVLGTLLLIGAAVAVLFGKTILAAALGVPAVACLVGAGAGLGYRVRQRRWCRDAGDGFVLLDEGGERRVGDDEVLSMALLFKKNYSNGLLKSVTRRFLVWLATDDTAPGRLELKTTIPAGQGDPLNGLINRIGDRLYEQAKEDLRAGRSALGEGWTWQGGELTVRDKGGETAVPVDEVVAVDSVDENFCIWRRGQDAAFARVPTDSANAYVLARLLGEYLANRPTKEEAAPADGQLGRIIFERSPKTGTKVGLLLLTVILGLIAVLFAVLAAGKPGDFIWWALGFLALTVALGLGWAHCRRATFRCHQYGVFKSGLTGERSLRYADVERFTYSAVRHFHNGVYTGTIFQLAFDPVPERKSDRITYQVTLKNADEELDNLRDQVARMIAARMGAKLAAGEPVPWTANLRFLPEGIEHRPGGFLGRKEPVVIPYGEIVNFGLDQGTFSLWVKGRKKPGVTEDMSRPNFFPGYFLLLSMSSGPGAD